MTTVASASEHYLRVIGYNSLPVSRAHQVPVTVPGNMGSVLQGDGAWEPKEAKDAKTQLRPANSSKDQARHAPPLISLMVSQHVQPCRGSTCLVPGCHACCSVTAQMSAPQPKYSPCTCSTAGS